MLEIRELRKQFAGPHGVVRAVDGVSLTISAGEFVAVQGPSGCGKTTLLLAAGGLLRPDGGSVKLNGQDPYALSSEGRAKFRAANVGFVFQQFHLVPYLSVVENVLAPSLAIKSPGAKGRAMDLIGKLGLDSRADHVPAQLSTGERQRVALARALLNQPKLVLADEPTGNLDAENAKIVLKHLGDFVANGGAVLLVTHDRDAAAAAGRIVTMRDGVLAPAETATAGV